ncbi:hypothetical protein Tco_1282953 [Tanacetum coccineum]
MVLSLIVGYRYVEDLVLGEIWLMLAIPEQTATGKGTSNPLMAGSLPKTTKPTRESKGQWTVGVESLKEFTQLGFLDNGARVSVVKFEALPLHFCAALTWWNGHVRTLGHDAAYAMTWRIFKKKLSDKYCPNGEIKKLEIELWNLKVKGNDVAAYT